MLQPAACSQQEPRSRQALPFNSPLHADPLPRSLSLGIKSFSEDIFRSDSTEPAFAVFFTLVLSSSISTKILEY